jgi:predicted restriction endonuclease
VIPNREQRRRLVRQVPKPAKRIVSKQAGVRKVTLEGRCRACGHVPAGVPGDALERAHLVGKGGGRGDDVDDNIIPLCSKCHRSLHDHDKHWRVVADAVRENLTRDELAYVTRKIGPGWSYWIDKVYPRRDS